ncbi:acyl-CoA dehydrogenase family protein [Dactylosporangium sp. NPDC005572]|uniref:acyl-CoA dehydrogenase family protein n=1 Tax=Dactylosporangium sp. NPDC005572 TaxID=3156889 RepID=UPI0033A81C10
MSDLPLVTARLAERAADHDRDATFPHEGIELVHKHGLLTATVGARYGGEGAGLARTVDILTALGAGDPAVALVTAMTLFTHAAQARQPSWPEPYYAALLASSQAGPALVNALRVEPELGTPARGGLPATVARRDGDAWSLTGHKIFSTGAVALSWLLVWARTDEEEPRTGSFLVRGGSPGVRIEPTWDHLGLRASRSDDVYLDGVRVPLDATAGLTAPSPDARDEIGMAWNSLGLTALYLGVADAALEWLVRFLHERVPTSLGRPLATLPRFQSAVGEISARLTSAHVLVRALAAAADAGDAAQASIGKLIGTRAAIESVQEAVALIGNNALNRRNPLERHLRDVLCARIHTPQDDTILAAAGRSALSRHHDKETTP